MAFSARADATMKQLRPSGGTQLFLRPMRQWLRTSSPGDKVVPSPRVRTGCSGLKSVRCIVLFMIQTPCQEPKPLPCLSGGNQRNVQFCTFALARQWRSALRLPRGKPVPTSRVSSPFLGRPFLRHASALAMPAWIARSMDTCWPGCRGD